MVLIRRGRWWPGSTHTIVMTRLSLVRGTRAEKAWTDICICIALAWARGRRKTRSSKDCHSVVTFGISRRHRWRPLGIHLQNAKHVMTTPPPRIRVLHCSLQKWEKAMYSSRWACGVGEERTKKKVQSARQARYCQQICQCFQRNLHFPCVPSQFVRPNLLSAYR
jgi:hypothetical protein